MLPLRVLELTLRQGRVPSVDIPSEGQTWGLQHAIARLVRAQREAEFGLDHAVLLRQCLRLLRPDESVVVESVSANVHQHLEAVGLQRAIDGSIQALPFSPIWLATPTSQGVDVPARECVLDDEPLSGEAWLFDLLGKRTWRSQAQHEATWSALTAPRNSTVLVGLPTGAGKSLVYQVCAAFERGLTVVVVPTIALGLDQIKALLRMPIAETHRPRLYTSDEHAETVLEEVKSGRCRLLITSPEAIVAGRLGDILRAFAREGWLHRLVIDEAHIVDSWGASFRVEFQLLASQLRTWRSESPQGVRALLLSATFGPGTPDMLRNLFAGDGVSWESFVIQRLRPEIHYFSPGHPLSAEGFAEAVMQALLHLPRPAILYVTKRKDAEDWTARLRNAGLKRLECFHGDTPQPERNRILDDWREDRLDLVVATSAFGLGVDKADVRAVVHACFPENIDRYYQEVGRGGRDGAPSVAVALWTAEDRAFGGSMGPRLLSDEAKIRGRWDAMWRHSEPDETGVRHRVPVWVAPDHLLHERTYEESVTWNKRLLLMMERAGLLQIVGMEVAPAEDQQHRRQWATLVMKCGTTNLAAQLPGLIRPTRTQELRALDAACTRLDAMLLNADPACRTLRGHYGRSTYRACGSCASCRLDPTNRAGTVPLVLRVQQPRTQPRIDVVYGPSPSFKKDEGRIVMALRSVLREGLGSRFVTGEHFYDKARGLLDKAGAHGERPYRLDLLTGDTAHSVRSEEVVVCLHHQAVHSHAAMLHERGLLCAHWMLGVSYEEGSSHWPFMHEYQSRRFDGPEALNEWVDSRLELRSNPIGTARVHR